MSPHTWPNPTDLDAVRAWNEQHRADPDAVRLWVAPLLARAAQLGEVPMLGSVAWRDLPDRDPRKYAALATTALAWLAENTDAAIADRLRRELDEFATAVRRMFADADTDVRRARVELGYSTGPTHAALVRRRNTHTCHWCDTTFSSPGGCPTGCGTPHQIHARAAASWAHLETEIPRRHRRSA